MGLQMLTYLTTRTPVDDSLKAFCEIYFVAYEVMGGTAWYGGSNPDSYGFALAHSEEVGFFALDIPPQPPRTPSLPYPRSLIEIPPD